MSILDFLKRNEVTKDYQKPLKPKTALGHYHDANDEIMYHLEQAQRLTGPSGRIHKTLEALERQDKIKEVKAGNKKIATFVTLFGQMPLDV